MKVNLYQLLIIILAGWNSVGFSQTYYYSNNQQIEISENRKQVIFFYSTVQDTFNYNDPDTFVSFLEYSGDSLGVIVYLDTEWEEDMTDLISYLGIEPMDIMGYSFSYSFADGTLIFPSFKIVLKMQNGYDESDIDSLLVANSLSYLGTNYGIISLSATDPVSTIALANILNNSNLVEWSHPDFLVKAIPAATYPTDALFPNQYYLNNTGQTGGAFDADIDAPEAWDLTTGNSTIKVAVVEAGSGIDPHPDLMDAISNSRVLSGYTWDGAINPVFGALPGSAATPSEKHGEPVAGIIAATHGYNSSACGVSGLCPFCKIIPVRASSTFIFSSIFADAINWSYKPSKGNADIINCSWNLGVGVFYNVITNAINDAMTLGRNGKGCPVIFSAGNTGAGVSYPADISGVICVSALDKYGNLTSYSSSGPEVTIAAFGGNPTSPIYCDIYSTSIVGAGTQSSCGGNDYIHGFGGTSAAAPQVAGIVALLLSIDPGLYAYQCSCRVANSATDIGAFGFDNLYGHGRANAYYAIALTNLSLIDEVIAGEQYFAATDFILGPAANNILPMNGCVIQNNANVSAVAGRGVVLDPGFKSEYGSVFSATINTTTPCGANNGGPFRFSKPEISASQITDLQNKIKISPNPTIFNLLVTSSDNAINLKKISVKDIMGRVNQSFLLSDEKSFMLAVASLNAGIYFLEIETNFGIVIKKFIKQ